MTDEPTAEQIALAREIAEHLVHGLATENEVRCALAAIIETTERAAKHCTSFLVGDPKNGIPLRNPMAHEIATALRAGDHLK